MKKQSDMNIGETIKEALDNYKPTTSFEEIWSNQKGKSNFSLRKRYSIPLVAMIICISLFAVGFTSYQIARNVDKIDYPFIDDANVIGKWKTVDFVKNIADFNQGKRATTMELYLTELVFIKDGNMLGSFENGNLAKTITTWTKGKIINKQEKTASNYDIRNINGKTYLFIQWKSGDYIFRGMEPYYYVLEKVDSKDYSNYKVLKVKEDKVDYPFVSDIQMLGRWESIDFVDKIEHFKPDQKYWLDNLYLVKLEVLNNGRIKFLTTYNEISNKSIRWTKGFIINENQKTASKCIIKKIDGNTYMFYEWKSGDYTYRGITPYYCVLKKVN